jgi:hypothetical protein
MILGFTGTQGAVKLIQFDALVELVKRLNPEEAHHGDCIGADDLFHDICMDLDIPVIIHPPINASKRAYCEGFLGRWLEKDYIVRNHDIVDESEIVIAVPPTAEELKRSGTWSTWRYAKKTGKETYLVLPNGDIEHG